MKQNITNLALDLIPQIYEGFHLVCSLFSLLEPTSGQRCTISVRRQSRFKSSSPLPETMHLKLEKRSINLLQTYYSSTLFYWKLIPSWGGSNILFHMFVNFYSNRTKGILEPATQTEPMSSHPRSDELKASVLYKYPLWS